ncbi:MAG: photosystem II reaction center protein T [Cyanobacteria bacterium J06626_14]|nr:photosystem II reaction center protein T [Leptolyngbyaceae bacterium]
MESLAYILVVFGALAVLFFAIAFREPPRINKD